ncbi:transcriptional regulator EutR [compost metagenome]
MLRQLSGVERAPRQLCADLRQRFQKIFDGVGANPHTLADERSCQLLCDDIMYTLFDVMASLGKIQPHMPGQIVHRYIVEKSREYILSRRNQPPTVAEVCQELHISRRTLHYAFQKVLDINPVTFLRYIRLHGIRQELLSMLPGQHFINEVAARWGFWHLGMFSTYYKQLFGETPSDTIRKATPKA